MKAKKIYYLASALVITSMVLFFSCKKDNTNANTSITSSQVNETQQSESQDAMADKVDQDLDNNLDKLESNGYSTSGRKAALDDCVGVTIDSSAGGWPHQRTVTLVYDCQDTVNAEVIKQSGTIVIKVDRGKLTTGEYLYTRSITFTNYKVKADSVSIFSPTTSPSITINGTRTLKRTKISSKILSNKLINIDVSDSITSNMSFAVKYTDTTVSFIRIVNRERIAKLYMKKITGTTIWFSDVPKDTITYTGIVTGTNARGKSYIREITTPIEITFCPLWPYNLIVSSGVIGFSNDGGKVGDITYSGDGCKTKVTLTINGKTKTIERKFGRKFRRWW